ncbi:MAG TPA: type II secretion system protein [Pyrinomonadaceae bacterium]
MAGKHSNREAGFSIVEMIVTMTIMLVIMGLVTTLFSRSLNTKSRESSKTDALTAAQAALNVMSREIANSGYGTVTNGLMPDSSDEQLHFVSNHVNTNDNLLQPGENIRYYFEPTTESILRYDANGAGPASPTTSIIINRISRVDYEYFNYTLANPLPTVTSAPTADTGRVRITLTVNLERVEGQTNPDAVILTSDVTLRNSAYMLRNY